jgi:uncharacterized protein
MAFWHNKPLSEMTTDEWESLCDSCGKCCLHKLEDEGSGKVYYTNVACRLLDLGNCRCTHYVERKRYVPECLSLRQMDMSEFSWLPSTCAYRLLAEGKDLADWHPLVSGKASTVIDAGVSIKVFATPETQVEDFEDHIIEWLE